MASKTIQSGTRNPRYGNLELDPTRSYVRVQRDVDSLQYVSPAEQMLNTVSPTDSSQFMYREENVDAKTTGNKHIMLLSCSAEDHKLSLKADADAAQAMERSLNVKKGGNKMKTIEAEEETFGHRGMIESE